MPVKVQRAIARCTPKIGYVLYVQRQVRANVLIDGHAAVLLQIGRDIETEQIASSLLAVAEHGARSTYRLLLWVQELTRCAWIGRVC